VPEHRVLQRLLGAHRHAAQRVDHGLESGEVDADEVVDVQAGQLLHELGDAPRSALEVGVVELDSRLRRYHLRRVRRGVVVPSVARRQVDLDVAREGHEDDAAAVGGDVHDDRGVRAGPAHLPDGACADGSAGPRPAVRAHQQEVLVTELLIGLLDRRRPLVECLHRAHLGVDVAQRRPCGAGDPEDEQRHQRDRRLAQPGRAPRAPGLLGLEPGLRARGGRAGLAGGGWWVFTDARRWRCRDGQAGDGQGHDGFTTQGGVLLDHGRQHRGVVVHLPRNVLCVGGGHRLGVFARPRALPRCRRVSETVARSGSGVGSGGRLVLAHRLPPRRPPRVGHARADGAGPPDATDRHRRATRRTPAQPSTAQPPSRSRTRRRRPAAPASRSGDPGEARNATALRPLAFAA